MMEEVEPVDRSLDTSEHGFISRDIASQRQVETTNYLTDLFSCCCDNFASRDSFDTSFPETNCRNITENDVSNLLSFIKKYRLDRQWDFILRNTRQGWFFGLFNYIGHGSNLVNRLLTDRCEENGIDHCHNKKLKDQAVSDIRDLDMLFNFIPKTTREFYVYRCFQNTTSNIKNTGNEIHYSNFLSTTLSFNFAKKFCSSAPIEDRPIIVYIQIPKNSSVVPIIDQTKIYHDSTILTEFEILLDRKGILVKMNKLQRKNVLKKIGKEKYDLIRGFFIYKSPEIRDMTDYTPILGGMKKTKAMKKSIKTLTKRFKYLRGNSHTMG